MPRARNYLSILPVVAGLLLFASPGPFAQSSHEGHHPAEKTPAGTATPATPTPLATPSDTSAQMKGGGMGAMMSGDHMSKMMEMMEDMHGKMMGGGTMMQPKGDTSPSSLAFCGVIAKMQQEMALTYTGNADVDFAKAMIAHHQGAIDMAKTVLAFGKDPEIKKMAESVVEAQEAELGLFKEWLKLKGQ